MPLVPVGAGLRPKPGRGPLNWVGVSLEPFLPTVRTKAEITLFGMEFEAEAVGKQLLHHDAELFVAGYAVLVGDTGDVEAVLVHPVGSVDYLFSVDVVGEGYEIGERSVRDGEVPALQLESLDTGAAGVVGLDGDDVKGWVGVRGHQPGWGWRRGNFPGGVLVGAKEGEGHGLHPRSRYR